MSVNLHIDDEFVAVVTLDQAEELRKIAHVVDHDDLVRRAMRYEEDNRLSAYEVGGSDTSSNDDPPPPGCAVATLALIGSGLTVLAEVGYRVIQWVN